MITLLGHFFRRMLTRGRLIGLIALSSLAAIVVWLSQGGEFGRGEVYPTAVTTAGVTFAIAVLILTVGTLRDERDGGTLPTSTCVRSENGFAAASCGRRRPAIVIGVGAWIATCSGRWPAASTCRDLRRPLAVRHCGDRVRRHLRAARVPRPRSLLFGLGYVVVLEQIVGFMVNRVAQLSIWRIAVSIYADIAPTVPSAMKRARPGDTRCHRRLIKIGIVLVVGWLVLTWALKERDAV